MQARQFFKKRIWALLFALSPLFLFFVASASAQTSVMDSLSVVYSIKLEGNNITRSSIIIRELVFKEGDTISLSNLANLCKQSEQNLLNTSLFNFVTINSFFGYKGIDISISVVERWYIWPHPIFEITDRNINSWWANHDFTRVNYGFRIKWSNFRGRMENIDLFLRFGKNHQYSLIYELPYINKKKRLGVGVEVGYTRKREVGYETRNDKLLYLFNKDFLIHQQYAAARLSYRRNISTSHLLELRLQHVDFSDSLLSHKPDYYYTSQTASDYLSLYYKLKIDHRDAKYYPLKGWYFDAEFYKGGLGLKFEEQVNVFWVRSTSRLFMPLSQRWFFGTSFVGKVSSSSYQPYFFMQGLGYDRDFVRGYEYYVVDGKHYGLSRNTIKFAVLPERKSNLAFISSQKFSRIHYAAYLTLFADVGYSWLDKAYKPVLNELPETILIGTGLGLDFVTYYDKVIRFEYSMNKLGESGIFIHLIAGI
jgi:outer membrane protein assembly factor BamA